MQISKQGYVIYEGRIVFCEKDNLITDKGLVCVFWVPKYPEAMPQVFGVEEFGEE